MKLLQIHPSDTVAVAITAIAAGDTLEAGGYTVTALDPIPAGHKIALRDIAAGENVIKYACPIGHAAADIPAGSHVHTHNVKSNLSGQLSYTYT
ncbi:MAG: UxaA family hydrolase, partial [Clostridia bacterium]|nr:UxaA family hydrolase [Clostridia bacterium]